MLIFSLVFLSCVDLGGFYRVAAVTVSLTSFPFLLFVGKTITLRISTETSISFARFIEPSSVRNCKMALLHKPFVVVFCRRNEEEGKVQSHREKKAQVLVQIRLTAKAFLLQIAQTNAF